MRLTFSGDCSAAIASAVPPATAPSGGDGADDCAAWPDAHADEVLAHRGERRIGREIHDADRQALHVAESMADDERLVPARARQPLVVDRPRHHHEPRGDAVPQPSGEGEVALLDRAHDREQVGTRRALVKLDRHLERVVLEDELSRDLRADQDRDPAVEIGKRDAVVDERLHRADAGELRLADLVGE